VNGSPRRRGWVAAVIAPVALSWVGFVAGPVPTARALPAASCPGVYASTCGVIADPGGGDFHGVIAVDGSSWVLASAASGGTEPGCGDCTWTLVLACPNVYANDPGSEGNACLDAFGTTTCPPGEALFRLYLTTRAVLDEMTGTVCVGPDHPVVPVSDIAALDIEDYLTDVRPPDLAIVRRPRGATLAGLTTYFSARNPARGRSTVVGRGSITEAITIRPESLDWHWGDRSASGWSGRRTAATHVYRDGGSVRGRLDTRWSAVYTIRYAGLTLGPYDADRTVNHDQRFALNVRTASQSLVAGG